MYICMCAFTLNLNGKSPFSNHREYRLDTEFWSLNLHLERDSIYYQKVFLTLSILLVFGVNDIFVE